MSAGRIAFRLRAGVLAATVAVSGCSAQDVPDVGATAAGGVAPAATPPLVSPQLTGGPRSSLAPPSRPSAAVTSSRPTDVTQDAAARYVPQAPAGPTEPAATVAAGVDYADPLAVAAGYVASRLTYRFDDPISYTAALTSPVFTTASFAARSTPNAAALARLAISQEASAAHVAGAELEHDAPNSAGTRYVVVTCSVNTAYRGGGGTAAASWTLRLLQVTPGQWRVDGVLSTD